MLLCGEILAQGIYNNGAKIIVTSGAYLNISGAAGGLKNETNVTDGAMVLNGTFQITGNFVNNANSDFVDPASAGEVVFNGVTKQNITGSSPQTTNFINVKIDNPEGIGLIRDIVIAGILNMTNGLLDIGSANLLFKPAATITGTYGSTNMIVASGTGEVRKEFSAAGTFMFPVGDNIFTPDYSPVTLNLTSGTFAPGAFIGLNLVNGKYDDPIMTGSYLNRYWNISQSGITSFTCDAVFQYVQADVIGTESELYCTRIFPSPSTTFSAADQTLNLLTANNLDLLGAFTGARGIRILNLKLYLEGLYNGSGTMRFAQGLTGNQYPGTTADQISVELHSSVPGEYTTILYTGSNINLSTSGDATLQVPASFSGSYYITIVHRNSIKTVSAMPVSFSGMLISYNFSTAASQAYGNNQKDIGGVFVIYGGDIDGDGSVGIADMGLVDNASALFINGYVAEDADGDGSVGIADMGLVDNNSANFVSSITPI